MYNQIGKIQIIQVRAPFINDVDNFYKTDIDFSKEWNMNASCVSSKCSKY